MLFLSISCDLVIEFYNIGEVFMSALENVSQEDLKNPDYVPPLQVGLVLGLQHACISDVCK